MAWGMTVDRISEQGHLITLIEVSGCDLSHLATNLPHNVHNCMAITIQTRQIAYPTEPKFNHSPNLIYKYS